MRYRLIPPYGEGIISIKNNNDHHHRFTAIVQVNLEGSVGAKFYCPHALAE